MKEFFRDIWKQYRESKLAMFGLFFIVGITLVAIFAPFFAPHSPLEQFRDNILQPPWWAEEGTSSYILGTDAVGRDILSRLIYGARYSLLIGFVVVLISGSTGVLLGTVSGFFGGWVDTVLSRIMDVILSFPSLLLSLVMVAIIGPGLVNIMIAVAIVQLPHFVRLSRAAIIQEKSKDYYLSDVLIGSGKFRLMFVTLLPNSLSPLIVQATLNFSNAILDAAALGFLGLGAQPPTPEWGTMLAEAREFILSAWWVITFPGLAILASVLSFNIIGDRLRDILDPKLKKS